ncbi:MAG: peptidase S8, partial [Novosphingobium sp.]|nr:peptidase S8 [Novosphingobium sp.]
GYTLARSSGIISGGSRLVSNGWAFDVTRSSLFQKNDSLALRISQPLRVRSGGIGFDLPVAYSYETGQSSRATRRLKLAPRGREITSELAWRGALLGGSASASLFYRMDPGHHEDLPDDKGVGFSWSTRF